MESFLSSSVTPTSTAPGKMRRVRPESSPCFRAACCGAKPCMIYGDGRSTRDYVYVGDVVRANQLALTCADGGTFNIGTGQQTDHSHGVRHGTRGGGPHAGRGAGRSPAARVCVGEGGRGLPQRVGQPPGKRNPRLDTANFLPGRCCPHRGMVGTATPECRPASSTTCRCWGFCKDDPARITGMPRVILEQAIRLQTLPDCETTFCATEDPARCPPFYPVAPRAGASARRAPVGGRGGHAGPCRFARSGRVSHSALGDSGRGAAIPESIGRANGV